MSVAPKVDVSNKILTETTTIAQLDEDLGIIRACGVGLKAAEV